MRNGGNIIYDFFLKVALNKITGYSEISLVGNNPNVGTGTTATVWGQGGTYNWLTSASNFYVSSSSTSDTAVTLTLTVLDINYIESTVQVTLNGQTPVLVSGGQYFRLNRAINISANSALGDIYISTTDIGTSGGIPASPTTILGKIFAGYNIMHNGIYSVPAGKTLLVQTIRTWIGKSNDARVDLWLKPYGGVWIKNISFLIFENGIENFFPTPSRLSEKTDVEFKMTALTNNIEATINVWSIIVDNRFI